MKIDKNIIFISITLIFLFLISLLFVKSTYITNTELNVYPNETSIRDFYTEVAKGNVPGHSAINKFGHNPSISTASDPEDVWSGGGIYNFYPSTAQSCNISSTDADDTNGGTGGNSVILFGLDEDWKEVSQTVYLDGTNNVSLNQTYIRMYRGVVYTAGSYGTNEGDIKVNCNGIIAINIEQDDGQTQQAIYTIPINKTGYFIKGYVGISKGGGATVYSVEFKWKARPNNGFTGAWQTKGQIETITHGNSWWQYEYGIPAGTLPEKTDIRIEVKEVTGTVGVVGGFDLLLVDNNLSVT